GTHRPSRGHHRAHQGVAGKSTGAGPSRARRGGARNGRHSAPLTASSQPMPLYKAQQRALEQPAFLVFNHLTLRAILAALTALLICFVIGPWMIRKLSLNQIGQQVRADGPSTHLPKAGTPTMGGLLILVAMCASTLLWADLANRFVWIVLGVTLAFGMIGFWDDYLKLVVGNSRGLIARYKYFWQSVVGMGCAIALYVT